MITIPQEWIDGVVETAHRNSEKAEDILQKEIKSLKQNKELQKVIKLSKELSDFMYSIPEIPEFKELFFSGNNLKGLNYTNIISLYRTKEREGIPALTMYDNRSDDIRILASLNTTAAHEAIHDGELWRVGYLNREGLIEYRQSKDEYDISVEKFFFATPFVLEGKSVSNFKKEVLDNVAEGLAGLMSSDMAQVKIHAHHKLEQNHYAVKNFLEHQDNLLR